MVMNAQEDHKQQAHTFYREALLLLRESQVPFLLGGGFAFYHHTRIYRDTKDLDIFCKASDCPRILKYFAANGYQTELTDARWLAKVYHGDHFMDIIFDTVNNICRVDDTWFTHAVDGAFAQVPVKLLSAVELIWCKIYVQNRERYDGADVNHLLLCQGKQLDWTRLLSRLDQHWHLLLAQLILFQFTYPADYRDIIPLWLFEELMQRAADQYALPAPLERVCRGPIIDQTQYSVDVREWQYKATTIKTV